MQRSWEECLTVTGIQDSERRCRVSRGCMACAGANTEVRRCIIDKNARIGSNCKIINTANVQEANKEEDGYVIKDGIVVVIKSSVFPGVLSAPALASRIGCMTTRSCMMESETTREALRLFW